MDNDCHGISRTGGGPVVEHRGLRVFGAPRQRARLLQSGPCERGADDRALLVRDPALRRLEVTRIDTLEPAVAAAHRRHVDDTLGGLAACPPRCFLLRSRTWPVPDRLRRLRNGAP